MLLVRPIERSPSSRRLDRYKNAGFGLLRCGGSSPVPVLLLLLLRRHQSDGERERELSENQVEEGKERRFLGVSELGTSGRAGGSSSA